MFGETLPTDVDREEKLCRRCLERGGMCGSCIRGLLPRIAVNVGWLKLMTAAKHRANPLAETPAADVATARAVRREQRKAVKRARAKVDRIERLISGQFARAVPRRLPVPLPT